MTSMCFICVFNKLYLPQYPLAFSPLVVPERGLLGPPLAFAKLEKLEHSNLAR